jgi:hypothetical protein
VWLRPLAEQHFLRAVPGSATLLDPTLQLWFGYGTRDSTWQDFKNRRVARKGAQ